MTSHIGEQVWKEDIRDQQEVATDSWRVVYGWIERLRYQQRMVSPEQAQVMEVLVMHLSEVNDQFAAASKKLKELIACFPEQPR